LFKAWQAEADSLGLDLSGIGNGQLLNMAEQPLALLSDPHPGLDIDAILKSLTAQASTFTIMQLEAEIAIAAQGRLDAKQVEQWVRDAVAARVREQGLYALVRLQDKSENADTRRRQTERFTTREMLEIENRIIHHAVARQAEESHIVSCDEAQIRYPSLSDEQSNALHHITEEPGAVKAVRGLAGTGKSFMLRAARESWMESNFTVTGAALAGKAAQSLEEGSGIKSQTLHSLLDEMSTGKKTLSSRDIIVIDEAAMVGSRQMHDILNYIHTAGAKVVLVGDQLQLQPIDAGGIFRSLSDKLGFASLTDIRRQESESDRAMIHDLINGRSDDVIKSLAERGMLEVAPIENVYNVIIDQWARELNPEAIHQSLILAGTRADVYKVNMLAREALAQQHRLHSEVLVTTEHGERAMAIGERILFTRNNRALGVKNGQTGTMTKWSLDHLGNLILDIETDAGKTVSVNPDQYGHIDYGYAMSVHKAQGQTIDKVYLLISEMMTDREWAYVATSRHREQLRVYLPEELSDEFSRLVSTSHQKEVSHDFTVINPTYASKDAELEVELGE
jgi:Ti-type conjugative transfer relaxase TraA